MVYLIEIVVESNEGSIYFDLIHEIQNLVNVQFIHI